MKLKMIKSKHVIPTESASVVKLAHSFGTFGSLTIISYTILI